MSSIANAGGWFSGRRFCVGLFLAIIGSAAHAMVPPSERAVLDAIWYGTGGQLPGGTDSTWINRGGWGLPVFLGISECGSYGITCVVDQGQEHIFSIDLHQNGLTGQLPASLSDLPYLETFDVYGNAIGGAIPSLTGLTNLVYFDVDNNQFVGSIPSLGGSPNLHYFYAYANQLTGPIPVLTGLSSLYDFQVDENQLTGAIPALSGLTNLRYFTASYNQLSGTIPSVANLTNLLALDLESNQLTGTIPPLTGLTNMKYFYADSNKLAGAIPALTGLTNLRDFVVYDNQLTGTIPALSGLTTLKYFWVHANRLTGSVPTAPPNLQSASLCPNPLTIVSQPSIDPAWDLATGNTPWWATPFPTNQCDELFYNDFETQFIP